MPLLRPKQPQNTTSRPRNRAAEHNVRADAARAFQQAPAGLAERQLSEDPGNGPEISPQQPGNSTHIRRPLPEGGQKSAGNPLWEKFQEITRPSKRYSKSPLPRKYKMRAAAWDLSSILSLLVNAVLLGVVMLLAMRINTLQNTITSLLGGLYDNFVRMDESYITTTIAVQDMPIPLDFILPVVQDQTNVTLTQDVTIRNAYVVITTGAVNINSPATVTLPAGTTLPVSLRMEVPVQTTVLLDLQVPVNIELATAHTSDPAVANLHTAFLGLQDTIGPLYCLLKPTALDYLSHPLCNLEGQYVNRVPVHP